MDLKVLIVVDMQQGFIDKNNFYLIEKTNELMKNYDKVFLTKFINKKGSFFDKQMNWKKLQTKESQELVVDIPSNAFVFEKYGFSIESKDFKTIKNLKINKVDIAGLKADACVNAISFQCFDNGIYPNILFNYTYTKMPRNTVKKILTTNFGQVDERE